MTFSEKLMQLRRQKGWSQEELGERLDVTRQTVSKWELGSTTPEMEKLIAMSELFGVSIDELVKNSGIESFPAEEAEKISETKPRMVRLGEWKSKRTWRGMPIVHINARGAAKGVIAIGLAAKGIVAIGLASIGVLSLGVVTAGVLAFGGLAAVGIGASGGLAAGVFACGGCAAGFFALGGVATGWNVFGGVAAGKYAFGGLAMGDIAVGGSASGIIAIGKETSGEITVNLPVTAEEVRAIITERLPNTPKFIVDSLSSIAEHIIE
ncbi:MAG: helix-turn-helix transcriptional regulator [Oscillospiraceae bacterium]|nr:helix-turn-helix transcriptional regulator [Oscillospiraceae bacterium]